MLSLKPETDDRVAKWLGWVLAALSASLVGLVMLFIYASVKGC